MSRRHSFHDVEPTKRSDEEAYHARCQLSPDASEETEVLHEMIQKDPELYKQHQTWIRAHYQWLQEYDDISVGQVTLNFQRTLLERVINDGKGLDKAAAFIDLKTLENLSYIHHLDYKESEQKAVDGKWLLRFSSQHDILSCPGSRIFVVVHPSGQSRALFIQGVGYVLTGSDVPTSIDDAIGNYAVYPSLMELLEASRGNLQWCDMLSVSQCSCYVLAHD
uniref:Uncharacterized protein n=1 Tax=viral metagenome TaxID=1070528 RepID=A0A6C0BQ44_9ZZZZ